MIYPETCIRGILKTNFIVKDPGRLYATVELFHFRSSEKPRQDRMLEASINWEDDEQTKDFTFQQQNNDGKLKYDGGIAIIPRSELDKIKKRYGTEQFEYERAVIPDNKYHGNLLLNSEAPTHFKRMICDILAHNSEIQERNLQ